MWGKTTHEKAPGNKMREITELAETLVEIAGEREETLSGSTLDRLTDTIQERMKADGIAGDAKTLVSSAVQAFGEKKKKKK